MAPPVPTVISIPAIRNKAQEVQDKWLYPQLHPEARKNHGSSWGVTVSPWPFSLRKLSISQRHGGSREPMSV